MTDKGLATVIALLVLAGMALVWFSTPTGPIFTADSISYIRDVRALQAGAGVLALNNHWPPGYPVLLSCVYSLFGSEILAARLISVVSLALSLSAVAIFTARLDQLRFTAILTPMVVLTHLLAPGFISTYSYALSEPPFMAALCWALVAYQRARVPEAGRSAWILLTCCLSAMLLLRYTALPFVAGILFCLAVQIHLSGRRWFLSVMGTGLACCIPLIGWLWLVSGEAGDAVREFSIHPLQYRHFIELSGSLARWMGGIDGRLAVVIYVVVLATVGWQWLQTRRPEILLLLTVSISYLTFLALSLIFFDAHTPLSTRIVLPLFPPFVLMLVCFCADNDLDWRGIDSNSVLAALLVVVTAFGLPALKLHLKTSAAGQLGSANVVERSRVLYRKAAALPADKPVYSNTSEILFLVYGRDVKLLPRLYDPLTLEQNVDFVTEIVAMINEMRRTDGVLLWMHVGRRRGYYPNLEELLQFPLKVVERTDGGYLLVPDVANQSL